MSGKAAGEEKVAGARWWQLCVSEGIPRRSLIVALLVGTLLNLINQGDLLLRGGSPDLTKLLLTYLVPYAVATYGAVSYRLRRGV